jgi:hypothetical protein
MRMPARSPRLSLFAAIFFLTLAAIRPGRAAPPAVTVDAETAVISGVRMVGSGLTANDVGSSSWSASFLERWRQGDGHWYVGTGFKAESFLFSPAGPFLPDRLQDYDAQISIEYFEGDESVAGLTLNPGWYFADHASMSAWDVPFDAFSAIPISRTWSGYVGLGNGRFYHHAIPAAGLIWEPTPQVRLEAVYPEPALVLTPSPAFSLRLGGELIGGGFHTDLPSHAGVVEYDSYRVGATATYKWKHLQVALDLGVEAERDFDFFRQPQQRVHGSGGRYGDLSVEWTP